MSVRFKWQQVIIAGRHFETDEIPLKTYENIIINQLQTVELNIPANITVLLFSEPAFKGDNIQLFSDCDWILIDKIGSILVDFKRKEQMTNLVTLSFLYGGQRRHVQLPQGIYLKLAVHNILRNGLQIYQIDKNSQIFDYGARGIQIHKTDQQPVVKLEYNDGQIIDLYPDSNVRQFGQILFNESTAVIVLQNGYKLVLFEMLNFSGEQLNIVGSIRLKPLGNVGSVRLQRMTPLDVSMQKIGINIYSRTEPVILVSLFIMFVLLIVLKRIIQFGANKMNQEEVHQDIVNKS